MTQQEDGDGSASTPVGAAEAVPSDDAVIRPMTTADVDEALDVHTAISAERVWLGTEPGFDRAARRERWLANVADPSVRGLVVQDVDSGRLLGHGTVYREPYRVAELGMGLAAAARGRGLGGRLLDGLIESARTLGAHKVELQVWPHNEPAIRLYLSRGFTIEGRLRSHYPRQTGEVWDAIVMGLLLDPELVEGRRASGLADSPLLPGQIDISSRR